MFFQEEGYEGTVVSGRKKLVARSGVGRALEHQRRALESAGIDYTFDPKDDYSWYI